ncbi:MAG: penicillin-binding protein 1C [Bacteroidetes bacterium]|nr:MAG: penicillin-binding protein 1C [Bacteroidota bacterium]
MLLIWFWFSLPKNLFNQPTSYVIEDANGNLLGASIAGDGQWRFPYDENVPEKFVQCIVAFEDKRFFYHPGIDILAMGRAIRQNLGSGRRVSGGSTITMQVMRISRNKERNLWQKFVESILAVRMEISYSKKEILALYASNAPFGSNVVGLDAASWRYFGRSPSQLSWGEMAALAVLPNSPALVHPGKNRDVLLKKRNQLLNKLFASRKIDAITYDLAMQEPLPGEPLPLPQLAPHLLQRFKDDFEKLKIDSRSTIVRTTIEIGLQKNVSQIVEQHHNFLKGNSINNACALVLDVETGKVLSYVGNIYHPEDPEMQSHVDIIKSLRSPGSTLKPLLYASMLSDGMILPRSLIPDIPTQIGGFRPRNFDMGYDGAVPAARALSRSLNIPAIRMLRDYKYSRFYDVLKRAGISTLNRPADTYGLSLVLGGCEVTMWDLAGAYASMARALNHQHKNKGAILQGDFHPPYYSNATYNSKGELSDFTNAFQEPQNVALLKTVEKSASKDQALNFFDVTSIWYTFQAMEEVMRPGEEGLWQQFTSSQRIAWKTGTSFGFRDAWAIGVTPKYVVAVWVGNADAEGRPGLIGVQAAAPLMFDIFRVLPSTKWFAEPDFNYSFVPVCRQSGYRANVDCPDVDTLMVPQSGTRAPLCSYHKLIHLDASGKLRVTEQCESPSRMIHKSWFVLPPAMEWYYKQRHYDYQTLPPFKPNCGDVETGRQMDLIYPEQDSRIYVPLEISGERGKTIFKATHKNPSMKIFWHLDDEYIGSTTDFHQIALSPTPGKHFITIVDESGESITREFEILEKGK